MISKYAFVANNKMYNRYILFYLLFIEDIFSMIKRVRILKHTQVIFSSNLSSHLLFQLSIFLLQIFIDNFGLRTFMACLEVKKKEGEQSRGRKSNSITLFGSFLRKEGEEFGEVSTTSDPSFLIPPNWRDLEGEQSR